METADLQAVPGSGKTTALLAKLIALSRHCPLSKNRGILVLSHTNAAVDEIRERIGPHCPHLFKHPHFIGTIQSFVDQYLCIPGFTASYGFRPNHIDNDLYRKYHERAKIDETHLSAKPNSIGRLYYDSRLTQEEELLCGKGDPYEESRAKTTDTYKRVLALKKRLRRDGVLAFDEAYTIGRKYLDDHPALVRILRRRFRFIFVDEMQDMDSIQQGLIDDIFFCDDCILQRIGDKNQRIYVKDNEVDWVDRKAVLSLTGSHRLTPQTATCVNRFQSFGIGDYSIQGLRGEGPKPVIFTFSAEQVGSVLELVSAHLQKMVDSGQLGLPPNALVKAICWKKVHEDHQALTDYFPTYDDNKATPYPTRNTIIDYLGPCRNSDRTFKHRSQTIQELLVRVLRMKDVRTEKKKYYSVRSLRGWLKQQPGSTYEDFKAFLFSSTRLLLQGKYAEVIKETKTYLPKFLSVFETDLSTLDSFLQAEAQMASPLTVPTLESEERINVVNYHGFNIQISTVHSVKGQTHDVTIYLESVVNKYESQKVGNQISGLPLTKKEAKGKQKMDTLKMLYVGLSRPTQLACYVIDRDRFNEHLQKNLDKENWNIVHLPGPTPPAPPQSHES
jgi:DNA helicase-2/ATP-dependent DNA helicase PcrA